VTERLVEGTVERVDATLSRVRVGEDVLDCTVRRKLVKFAKGEKTVVVGDRVVVEQTDRGERVIAEVLPRRSSLSRPGFRSADERVIVANVDELVVVAAAAEPDYRTGLIDRYLVIAERVGFPGVVCINKVDLVDRAAIERALGFYRDLGYPVLFVSALDGTGLDELRDFLRGKTSVLCGHSGVGKSSLINRLIPGAELATLEVSDVTGKGRHVTSAVTMLALPGHAPRSADEAQASGTLAGSVPRDTSRRPDEAEAGGTPAGFLPSDVSRRADEAQASGTLAGFVPSDTSRRPTRSVAGYIVDTPGIREFGLWGVRRDELRRYFREFVPHEGRCRFNNCVHLAEPGCSVKAALNTGAIHQSRYASYQRLYDDLPATDWEQK
jgi:ribosome small subunit-dependent GTPase A